MLERLFQEREPLGAALATLSTDLTLFTPEDCQAMQSNATSPFHFIPKKIESHQTRSIYAKRTSLEQLNSHIIVPRDLRPHVGADPH